MEFKFVNQNSTYHKQGVALRISLFFDGFNNSQELINDTQENSSFHLACMNDDDVVIGTGRLTISNHAGIISQMAIDRNYQRQGVGKEILNLLIKKSIELNLKKIELRARITAIQFYTKFKFKVEGVSYASKKTGIVHQKMIREINSSI